MHFSFCICRYKEVRSKMHYSIRMAGGVVLTGCRFGDDVFAVGMSTIRDVVEESGIVTIGWVVDQTANHARPFCRLRPANGGIGQLSSHIIPTIHGFGFLRAIFQIQGFETAARDLADAFCFGFGHQFDDGSKQQWQI